jgi:hypothetical protein
MKANENEQFVIKGSKYRVASKNGDGAPIISTGEFRGYAAFSSELALVLKMDATDGSEGQLRFIPYHAILTIDVIEMASQQAKEEKRECQVYYG